MLPDLCYRGIPADHRHNPSIKVVKWGAWSAFDVGQNILGCPPSALLCYRTKLWQSVSVFSRDIGEVSDCIDAREVLHAKIRLNLDSPAASLREPRATGDRRGLEASCPNHAAAFDGAAVGQYHVAWMHFLHGSVEFEDHTAALQNPTCVIMGLSREGREERGAMLHQVDVGGFSETFTLCRQCRMNRVRQGARHLSARRSTADDHDVQRTLLDELGLAIRV